MTAISNSPTSFANTRLMLDSVLTPLLLVASIMQINCLFLLSILCISFIMAWVITGLLRRYAIRHAVLDIPNERSSHVIPTPRGGGLAFVIAFLGILPLVTYYGFITLHGQLALLGAGFFLAALGFLDDHANLSVKWRLVCQLTVSILAVYWIGGAPVISFGIWQISPGWIMNGLFVLYLVWLLNLYNFMDGIDGIASIEAITVCLSMVIIYMLNHQLSLIILPLVLIAAVSGFLCWNFPRARIFMGDVGSYFLGFMLGVLSLQAAHLYPNYLWSWLILLGVFIVDATFTLFRRLFQGKKPFEAHRTHAYQNAARLFKRHSVVTLAVGIVNFVWLLPIAILVGLNIVNGFVGLMVAYIPLIVLAELFYCGQLAYIK